MALIFATRPLNQTKHVILDEVVVINIFSLNSAAQVTHRQRVSIETHCLHPLLVRLIRHARRLPPSNMGVIPVTVRSAVDIIEVLAGVNIDDSNAGPHTPMLVVLLDPLRPVKEVTREDVEGL